MIVSVAVLRWLQPGCLYPLAAAWLSLAVFRWLQPGCLSRRSAGGCRGCLRWVRILTVMWSSGTFRWLPYLVSIAGPRWFVVKVRWLPFRTSSVSAIAGGRMFAMRSWLKLGDRHGKAGPLVIGGPT